MASTQEAEVAVSQDHMPLHSRLGDGVRSCLKNKRKQCREPLWGILKGKLHVLEDHSGVRLEGRVEGTSGGRETSRKTRAAGLELDGGIGEAGVTRLAERLNMGFKRSQLILKDLVAGCGGSHL